MKTTSPTTQQYKSPAQLKREPSSVGPGRGYAARTSYPASAAPAQLQAHAYAQGTDIHPGPKLEEQLPHEAWHAKQQKQKKARPTVQLKSKTPVNDDAGLEREADAMGALSLRTNPSKSPNDVLSMVSPAPVAQRHPVVDDMKSDEAIADEMDSGQILPYKVKLRDEVSRDGTPQQLAMLEYNEYNRVQVHIHIAQGTNFGHIKVGQQRHTLTPEQCESILANAGHTLTRIEYAKDSKHSQGKGARPGYDAPPKA